MTDHHVPDQVTLGFDAVLHGHLAAMREKTGLTVSGMARLIGTDPDALAIYERGERTMNMVTVKRIGAWYWHARHLLEEEPDIDFTQLIPAPGVAMLFGVKTLDIENVLKQKGLDYEDLGPLGLFVYRDQIPALNTEPVPVG